MLQKQLDDLQLTEFHFLLFPRACKSRELQRIMVHIFFRQIGKCPTKRKFIVAPNFFKGRAMTSEKCTRAHVQENKRIYFYLYIFLNYPIELVLESLIRLQM